MRRLAARLLWSIVLVGCSAPPPRPATTEPLALHVDEVAGTVAVARHGVTLQRVRPVVTVDGRELALQAKPSVERALSTDALGEAREVRLTYGAGALTVVATYRAYGEEQVTAEVSVACAAKCPQPAPRVNGFTLAGVVQADGVPTGVLVNGYSSWAPTFAGSLRGGLEQEEAFESVGNNEQHLLADARTSWWVSAASWPRGVLVTGALTAERWKSRILLYRREGEVRWRAVSGRTGDSLALTERRPRLSSERWWVSIDGGATEGLLAWGRRVATLQPRPVEPFVPVGWNSWNTFFEDIDEERIAGAAEALQRRLGAAALNNLQVDDGWQRRWGEWTANDRFPSGMRALAVRLEARGLKPGLWMAPFYADSRSQVVAEHPDWLLRDAKGERIRRGNALGSRELYVLDASHPEARAWIVGQVVQALEQGYRYLKLDFLFAGAHEGQRADPEQTGLEAFRATMKLIFAEADKRRAYVLACGAPILPSAGVAHGLRTGEDIAAASATYSFPWVKNAARNVALRFFVNPFIASDPDTALLRGLSPGEQRLHLTATALAGRLFALGDDPATLSDQEVARLSTALALPSPSSGAVTPGEGFVPMELLSRPVGTTTLSKLEIFTSPSSYSVPSVWRLELSDGGTLLALFNWGEEPQPVAVPMPDFEAVREMRELWTGTRIEHSGRQLELTIPARDAWLVQLHRPAPAN